MACFGQLEFLKPVCLLLAVSCLPIDGIAKDISVLSEHFNEPGADISPWMFTPEENIKKHSTTHHPGLMAVWENGQGKDIKGILQDPIRIDDYALPWEFHLGLTQNHAAMLGRNAVTQANYAIGLNVAVTFSDPSTWPEDRTQRPADTRWIQLLVVHLGATGTEGLGLPQYSSLPTPETYFVWGRGNFGLTVRGDWQVPHLWAGDGVRKAGPASDQLYFRLRVVNRTTLDIGLRFDPSHPFNMRRIDCSKLGEITGIWEVGPVFSCDRWIPDTLCRNLTWKRRPMTLAMGELIASVDEGGNYSAEYIKYYETPDPEPPNPKYEYYVDHCTFIARDAASFEDFSDDFDIPGYLAKWQSQPHGATIDTYNNPGYLTMNLVGAGGSTGFQTVGSPEFDLSQYKPPWEVEIAFIGPDDRYPWSFWLNWEMADQEGNWKAHWQPGVQNLPKEEKHVAINGPLSKFTEKASPSFFDVEFPEDPPESVMAGRPLTMLIQVIDPSHLRVGFKAKPEDAWYLSKVFDCSEALGGPIKSFRQIGWSTATGGGWGEHPGSPMYQKFLIDHVRFRSGLRTED